MKSPFPKQPQITDALVLLRAAQASVYYDRTVTDGRRRRAWYKVARAAEYLEKQS